MSKRIEKIAGAILFALILIVGVNLGGDALDHALTPPAPAPAPTTAEAPEAAPAGEAATAQAPDAEAPTDAPVAAADGAPDPIAPLVAAASAESGKAAAKKCVACHTFDQGGPNRVGPNLHNVVGRDIGSVEGYAYSGPLKAAPGTWTVETLDSYLSDPRAAIPGNKMAFAGVKSAEERAALIAYLRSVSPDAPPLEE